MALYFAQKMGSIHGWKLTIVSLLELEWPLINFQRFNEIPKRLQWQKLDSLNYFHSSIIHAVDFFYCYNKYYECKMLFNMKTKHAWEKRQTNFASNTRKRQTNIKLIMNILTDKMCTMRISSGRNGIVEARRLQQSKSQWTWHWNNQITNLILHGIVCK